MGIYYAAVDRYEKTYFQSPKDFSIKSPGIYHWKNPFPQMLVMMNSRGYDFEIHNDMEAFYEEYCTYKDITDDVYQMLLDEYPEAKEFYESKDD